MYKPYGKADSFSGESLRVQPFSFVYISNGKRSVNILYPLLFIFAFYKKLL